MTRPVVANPPLARRPSMFTRESRVPMPQARALAAPPMPLWRQWAESAATTASVASLGALAVPSLTAWLKPAGPPSLHHALMGAAGAAGMVSTGLVAAAILGVAMGTATLWTSEARRGGLATAAAQGLALAPLAAQGLIAVAGPAGLVALGLVVGLTWRVISAVDGPARPPVGDVATMLICAFVLGPLGWDVALGTAPAVAACRAVVVGCLLALGRAVVAAAWQLQLHYAPTPYVQQFLCDPEQLHLQRLDLSPKPMAQPPTIFGVRDDLRATIDALMAARGALNTPFTGWRGVPVACLCGPAGTGKTLTAQGIAHALGAELAAVSSAELAVEAIAFAPVAGLNVLTLIAEAELYGQRVKKPVVIFIDEVDNFLPVGTHTARTHEDINRAINVALLHTTLTYLDDDISHVMVIFATNHVARIAPALGLLTLRTPLLLDIPSAEDIARVLANKCVLTQQHHKRLGVDCPRLDAHPQLAQMARQMADAGLSGRDAEAMVSSGSDAVLAYVGRRRTHATDAAAKPLDEVFFARLKQRLAITLAHARRRGPRQAAAPPKPIAPRSVREFLRDSGVHAADAEQLIRYAASAVAKGTTDPGQQLRMSQVGGRALRSAWQLVARATSSTNAGEQGRPRDFDDVPRR